MRKQRILLKYRVDLTFIRRQRCDVFSVKKTLPDFGSINPPMTRSVVVFTAAGRPQKRYKLLVVDIEIETVQNGLAIENQLQCLSTIQLHYYPYGLHPLCGIFPGNGPGQCQLCRPAKGLLHCSYPRLSGKIGLAATATHTITKFGTVKLRRVFRCILKHTNVLYRFVHILSIVFRKKFTNYLYISAYSALSEIIHLICSYFLSFSHFFFDFL